MIAISTAFLAQYIAGILQASITLAGIVGSPMLAVFTLGLFCPLANEPVRFIQYHQILCIELYMS